jgi:hypothetical protein
MSETKYIINSTNQSIDGDFTTTGTIKSNSVGVYKALFTQSNSQTGITSLSGFGNALIPGETYTIVSYQSGDDFSNIAHVISGTINQSGCVFAATGKFPTNWNNGSSLDSSGNLVVDVVENTLGYDISWSWTMGAYVGINDTTGPWINSFPRNRTSLKAGIMSLNIPIIFNSSPYMQILGGIGSIANTDDVIYFSPFDFDILSPITGALFYQYIEINLKQYSSDNILNIAGNVSTFPITNASISLVAGDNIVHTVYTPTTVSNMNELADLFNGNDVTSQLGTYSVNLDGDLILTMIENLKLQFAPDNTLIFQVFND